MVKKEKKDNEYSEFFEVEKNGKTKIIETKGIEKEEKPTINQVKQENKILRNLFIAVGILILLALLVYFLIYSTRHFEYQGLNFEVVKFCDVEPCLILYQTKFPVLNNGQAAEYNFYLRNDPRKTNVPFEGNLNFSKGITDGLRINITENLNCEGDAIIALGNIINFYSLLDVKFVRNETLGCDSNGKSFFLNIQEGEQTTVKQTGPFCYDIIIKDCEVLKGTEKYLFESFKELKRYSGI